MTPLANAVAEEAETLMRQTYALLPHVKVTDLLLEVDRWTGFIDDFTHLKSHEPAKDQAPTADGDPGRCNQPGIP